MSRAMRHDLGVQMVKVADLVPWDRNPRVNDAAAERLAYTIQEHGWTTPILVQRETGRIIGGHTRLKAAMKIGLDEVPVIHLDVEDRQADAIAIADNRLGEIAEWDNDELARLLEEIEADGGDLLAIGYNDADWSELLDSLDAEESFDELPGDVEPEEPPEEPVSRLGEVYELGPHRLVCGSSLDQDVRAEVIIGVSAVVTDPPYGIDASSMTMGLGESAKSRANRLSAVDKWDGKAPPVAWILDVAPEVCIWGGNYFPDLPVSDDWLVWHKKNDGRSFGEAELAWTNLGRRIRVLQHHWSGEKKMHITQKPLPVMDWCVGMVAPNAVVFDPFGGSGTTLIACARSGRTARLIELDPGYCDVIRRRWTKWAREAGQDPGPGALD